jgi:hypothetical protein
MKYYVFVRKIIKEDKIRHAVKLNNTKYYQINFITLPHILASRTVCVQLKQFRIY